jgi:hypothetical protein
MSASKTSPLLYLRQRCPEKRSLYATGQMIAFVGSTVPKNHRYQPDNRFYDVRQEKSPVMVLTSKT